MPKPDEGESGEEQELSLGEHVRRGVGLVDELEGHQGIEQPGRNADGDAESRRQRHREEHVGGRIRGADAGIVRKECEEGDLDAGVVEHPGGSEEQAQPNP